jgi:UDP-N-acetylmuramoyl-tripeptide--D-alanyl-D-alanine ligase
MPVEQIAESLASVEPPPQRGDVLHFAEGLTVINDSYNSNPSALLSMIETMVDGSTGAKRRIVVAGEMLELGENEKAIHAETGTKIAGRGVDMLIGVRHLARELVDGAREAGMKKAEFVEDSDAAAHRVAAIVQAGDVILVKGSRGVKTEKVVEALLDRFEVKTTAE